MFFHFCFPQAPRFSQFQSNFPVCPSKLSSFPLPQPNTHVPFWKPTAPIWLQPETSPPRSDVTSLENFLPFWLLRQQYTMYVENQQQATPFTLHFLSMERQKAY